MNTTAGAATGLSWFRGEGDGEGDGAALCGVGVEKSERWDSGGGVREAPRGEQSVCGGGGRRRKRTMQAVARAARGLAAAAASARPSAMEAGHRGQVQQARGIVVQVRDGNLERALSVMERKMRSSGMERLIRARTHHHVKDSEKRVLARKALMQRVRSQELGKKLREILIKKIRGQ